MEKQLKDFIHFYPDCDYLDLKTDSDDNIIKLDSITNWGCYDKDGNNIPFSELQPILRPLLDMTEDEAIEIGMYKKKEQWHELTWEEAQVRVKRALESKKEIEFTAREFMLLLSKHFDLFGLIDSQLAIDKCSLSEQSAQLKN